MKKFTYLLLLIPAFYTFQLIYFTSNFIINGISIGEERSSILVMMTMLSLLFSFIVGIINEK